MNKNATGENMLTLRHLLGIEEEAAEKILGSGILLTGTEEFPVLSEMIKDILQKTFKTVDVAPANGKDYQCEVIIGGRNPISSAPFVAIGINYSDQVLISAVQHAKPFPEGFHHFLFFLGACYCSALVFRTVCGTSLTVTTADEIFFSVTEIVGNPELLQIPIEFGEAWLVGAGAVGNSFLYALRTFNVSGSLHIVDPDLVSGGNLNRCLLFEEDDIGKKKAEVLAEKCLQVFSKVRFIPEATVLSNVEAKSAGGAWLEKLIVGVDSRRTRRSLQYEIP